MFLLSISSPGVVESIAKRPSWHLIFGSERDVVILNQLRPEYYEEVDRNGTHYAYNFFCLDNETSPGFTTIFFQRCISTQLLEYL